MSNLNRPVIIHAFPNAADYALRAGVVTGENEDGTVDVVVFNSQTDIREMSMPVVQSLGNVPLLEVDAPYPTDYRGRWIAVAKVEPKAAAPVAVEGVTPAEQDALNNAKPGDVVRVANLKGAVGKPKSAAKASR